MGLGIDYGSYFIARVEEEQAAGNELRQALVRAFVTTGAGIAATALTTVFTFGALLLTGFKPVPSWASSAAAVSCWRSWRLHSGFPHGNGCTRSVGRWWPLA